MSKLLAKRIKTVIVSFLLVSALFSIGCYKKRQMSAEQITPRNLVETFDKDWLKSDRERFMFNDRTNKKTLLGGAWTFDTDIPKTHFPWPRFTPEGGLVFLDWAQPMERRLIIKLVNILPAYADNLLQVSLNDEPIPFIESDLPVGEYEFYVPSPFQITGKNSLHISIDTDKLPPDVRLESIALHSIRVTLGAVVRSRIQIGNQIRDSLLFAPPIKLRIPVKGGIQNTIQFSYGLSSTSGNTSPLSYGLTLSLFDSKQNRVIHEQTLSIKRDTATLTEWNTFREKMPFLGNDGYLELSFMTGSEPSGPVDYLALSEFLLHPASMNWDLSVDVSEPDMLLITLSSISANQMGVYGNTIARTPFLDHLAQISKIYSDTTAVSNHEYSAIASLITGKLPRDHGYYRDFSASHELPPIITENLKDTSYLSHAFIYTSNQLVFTKLQGFRRIYLSSPKTHSIQTPETQLNSLMNSPQMIANPGFFWVHLAPELYSEFDSIEPFHLSAYHQKPVPISELNLPISEQDRLISMMSSESAEKDARELSACIDHRMMMLDKTVHDIFQKVVSKRHKRSIFFVITADHGLIRSLDSNLLSNDSLSQEVLHIPLFYGLIPADTSPVSAQLATQPVSSLKGYEILLQAMRKRTVDNGSTHQSSASVRSIFSEHHTRPIVAYRKDNYKLIHVFSNPYFQIATTNLFNLEEDPSESVNLVGRDTEITRNYLDTTLAFCHGSPFYPRPRIGFEDEALTILKSLKYTE